MIRENTLTGRTFREGHMNPPIYRWIHVSFHQKLKTHLSVENSPLKTLIRHREYTMYNNTENFCHVCQQDQTYQSSFTTVVCTEGEGGDDRDIQSRQHRYFDQTQHHVIEPRQIGGHDHHNGPEPSEERSPNQQMSWWRMRESCFY